MTKYLARLSLFAILVVGTAMRVDGAEPASGDTEAAHLLAVEALKAEVEGDFLSRQRLLAEALQADANCPLLNAQLGKVAIARNDWRSVDECVSLATANSILQQYHLTRGDRELAATEHFSIGQWCFSLGLIPQARAHLERVIQLEPEHTAAKQMLGYQRFGDEWVSPTEIIGLRRRAELSASSLQQFGEKLVAIHKKLGDQRPAERLHASEELLELQDPRAIPAVEAVFADALPQVAQLVVAWMKQVDAVESSQVLMRYSLFHPSVDVRAAAVEALKSRPLHDFVPDVLAMTISPVSSMLVPVFNPDRTLAGYRQAFAQETNNTRQMMIVDNVFERVSISMVRGEGSILIPSPQGRRQAQVINQAIEQAVNRAAQEDAVARQMAAQRENTAIARRNAVISVFLSNVTGAEIKPTAEAIWQWWDRENESISQFAKPRSLSRLAIGHSVPRYQAYQAYKPQEPYEMTPERMAALEQMARMQAELRRRVISGTGPVAECFAAGTLVTTLQGLRPIESIRTGDLVLTNSLHEGSLMWQPVISMTQRPPEPTYEIETAFGKYRCTGGHLFWVSGKGWTKTRHLASGDVLHAAGEPAVVCSVRERPAIETHNLRVAENANYLVGDEMILTHDVSEMLPSRTEVPGLNSVTSN